MANSLKGMMGMRQIPTTIQGALNMLGQMNPQAKTQVEQLMASGQNPTVIAQQMMSTMTPQQKMMFEQMTSKLR